MHEDAERCYRAVRSRDRRFDGRFITAVRTTGIYCRPSCPAQTPRRENVLFLPHPAAAAAAGFRACKRCRPDAAPGSPEWNVRADLAARALRGIASGVVDVEGVPGLARRLAVSERHLHRVLVAEIGAGPLALARTRRAQTARMLIEHTALPLAEVAFAAGFASVRQFNDVMRAEFGVAPGSLRRAPDAAGAAVGTVTVRLSHRTPYDGTSMLSWLAAHVVDGLEEVEDRTYRRAVGERVVELELPNEPEAGAVHARIDVAEVTALAAVVTHCRRLLDLDADPAAVDGTLRRDRLLAPLVRRHPGLRVPGAGDGFELAARTVLAQQVSLRAARTFAARLVRLCGKPLTSPLGAVTHEFPTAAAVAEADLATLGLTTGRARTLRALATAVADGDLDLDPSADREQTRRGLLALPGVGPWTAAYVAMRALGDPDAYPGTDLVLRRAVADPAQPERWRPWRAYAAMHLWTRHLEERS